MDARLGQSNFKIPVASLAIFNPISVIFWVPVYDRFIIPMTRKFTGHKNGLTQLQRIGTGLFISVFGMISAGILEMFRLGIVRRQNSYKVMEAPISVFWQVPQHVIVGCAEVFTNIGQLEFFYEEAPDSMRSLCAAMSLMTTALGNYLSSFLVAIVMAISTRDGRPGWIPDNLNYGHVHYFFLLLAMLSVLNLGVFIVVAKSWEGSATGNWVFRDAIHRPSGLRIQVTMDADFLSTANMNMLEDDDRVGRNFWGSNKERSGPRWTWIIVGDEALLNGLKSLITTGWKCENGFCNGYLAQLEVHMNRAFPQYHIKGEPHITFKLHMWKK
ncbi:UNVERIFIED_CONTAM: protein NRT1/ PTR FAMILY 8.1 [Sesamum radiatum]|uniref:Protein NRT1/ PTR FAMILY 8.1 n=1 Tax=Sesamum radiatum TaxID=300843 RepID=A0AAW2RIH4_SESRA